MQRTIQKKQRTENILLSLKKFDYLSRSQLQILHALGSDRNASRVMKDLEEYVHSFRDGENIYYLSKQGRELTGSKKVCKKTTQALHYIMRNDLYIAYECPSSWKNEMKLEVPGQVKIIADAIFQKDGRYHLVEVDNTQKMNKNRAKVDKYKALISLGVFKTPPKLIWVTTTEYRRRQLTELLEGLDFQIFTISDFH
ncbi:replication-relaxation family protein [Priestia filamentosa]|uniref:replication-relaxation family protein n=1 Tax=Priestia filamentosa TaxID=1402861 RepID=UPI000A16BB0B|nr:replication-relaxation family protein [Priestia filamentosa]MDT3762948.1 replication-relaxation family protein [Priestia filamentosa]OXS69470.1 hypothetical protein B1B01_10910 [Priestia filamentosa]